MALDDKSLERMLKAQKEALQRATPATPAPGHLDVPDNSHLFEEFQRPAQPGDKPKPRGLNAAGYQFPPQTGPPAMTKENLAKGVALPPSQNAVPPLPESKLVESDPLFEVYHRPDLEDKPRTGTGLRAGTMPKTAKEILKDYEPPTPQVFTGKREPHAPMPLPQAPPPIIRPAHSLTGAQPTPELDAAHLDAEADLASAPELTMSHSRDHGPAMTVTSHDPLHEMPSLPARPAHPSPAPTQATSMGAHTSDAPPVPPGDGPRIALVQADFNHALTTRMAQAAIAKAQELGCDLHLRVHVSGVFDIPLAAKALSRRDDVDAIIAIGCVIQGETGHDQLIAQECARKLADLAYDSEKPVGLAVTGPRMTRAAAEARAETVPRHAVEAVVKQWRALKALGATRLATR